MDSDVASGRHLITINVGVMRPIVFQSILLQSTEDSRFYGLWQPIADSGHVTSWAQNLYAALHCLIMAIWCTVACLSTSFTPFIID